MISSTSMQVYPSYDNNDSFSKSPITSRLINYNTDGYQTLNSFYSKSNKHKKNTSNLIALKFDAKNVGVDKLLLSDNKKTIYNAPITQNIHKKLFSQNKNKSEFYTSGNNIVNFTSSGIMVEMKSDYSNFDKNEINSAHRNIQNDVNFLTPRIGKIGKIDNPPFLKKKYSDQNHLFIHDENYNYNNFNSQLFSKAKDSNYYKNIKSALNNSANNLTNVNFNSSTDDYALTNYNSNYTDEEPKNDFKLTDLTILKEIGKGAEGVIYVIRWKKNNKKYAMKKCQIMFPINVKKRKNDNAALKNFIETTGCDGIIKPYATLCKTNEVGFTDCYEIMELADKDWETEIMNRSKQKKYYYEYELMEIFKYLIRIFALLQNNHITHRDIKPQNIMLINGKMKICDFGNVRVLKRNGIIIQRIRGSELFMSPIVFKGYRSGIQNIRHNAYKSDVYSLGICFFLAATLSYDGPNIIRLMTDMKKIKKVLDYNLSKRYSKQLINMIYIMLQVEESKRPDFLGLQVLFP